MKKGIKLLVTVVVALILGAILIPSSCSVVDPDERGVEVRMGKVVSTQPIEPGIVWHSPFISHIEKFSIVPHKYELTFSCNENGAFTEDKQTVGTTVIVWYRYDENRIIEIVKNYKDSRIIENALGDFVKASLKEVTGKYSASEIITSQDTVAKNVAEVLITKMANANYPITINKDDVQITNWDWSDEFDKYVQETANKNQQIEAAEAEARIVEAEAQKQVKEAEAKAQRDITEAQARKQVAELEAEAAKIKAQGEAEARKVAADALAYENKKKAENISTWKETNRHDEEMAKYGPDWNGKLFPDAFIMNPITGQSFMVKPSIN